MNKSTWLSLAFSTHNPAPAPCWNFHIIVPLIWDTICPILLTTCSCQWTLHMSFLTRPLAPISLPFAFPSPVQSWYTHIQKELWRLCGRHNTELRMNFGSNPDSATKELCDNGSRTRDLWSPFSFNIQGLLWNMPEALITFIPAWLVSLTLPWLYSHCFLPGLFNWPPNWRSFLSSSPSYSHKITFIKHIFDISHLLKKL